MASDMPNEMIWDPLRKKEVALTPEERVRQWFIGVLQNSLQVPPHMMMSEVGLKYGNGPIQKTYRADILVYDRNLKPMLVTECKRPDVPLTREVMEQALRYNMVLDVKYIVLTNGSNVLFLRKFRDGHVESLTDIPTYAQMLEAEAEA